MTNEEAIGKGLVKLIANRIDPARAGAPPRNLADPRFYFGGAHAWIAITANALPACDR